MSKINIKTGFSQNRNEKIATKECFEQINQEDMGLVIVFADGGYNQLNVNESWNEKIPEKTSFVGCSSVRANIPFARMTKNITSGGFKDGMVAMSISSQKIDFSIKVMRNIGEDWKKESERTLKEAASDLNLDLKNIDNKKSFGILLSDSLSLVEGNILKNLYAMSNLLFVGGGSSGKFNLATAIKDPSRMLFRGHIYTKEGAFLDSAAIILVKSEIPFEIDITTSYVPTKTKFEITKTKGRDIYELNGKPAIKEYARALGVPKVILGTQKISNFRFLIKHPIGLMVKDRAYIRSVVDIKKEALVVAADVEEGQTLCLMEREDIVESTRKMVERLKEKLGKISGMIMFNCGYRFLEADIFKVNKELFESINVAPLIGLNSFGEYYGWLSMTNSLVVSAFGDL